MGRIETYPFDTRITPNDYVIGTDGDNLNATRNYKVSDFLGYLGSYYNLNSQDVFFTYNPVAPALVSTGEISSNNYATVPAPMSGITNLYVSKASALGNLVDSFINAVATDQLTFVVMDMAAPENYAVFAMTGSSDVDANTINLAGTVSESNGNLVSGRSIGLKLNAGGGSVDLSGYVTIATNQTITGRKTFFQLDFENVGGGGYVGAPPRFQNTRPTTFNDSAAAFGHDSVDDVWFFQEQAGTLNYGLFDFKNITQDRTYTFQDADGTVKLGLLSGDGSNTTVTQNQTDQAICSLTLPANSISTGDVLKVRSHVTITGTATTFELNNGTTSIVNFTQNVADVVVVDMYLVYDGSTFRGSANIIGTNVTAGAAYTSVSFALTSTISNTLNIAITTGTSNSVVPNGSFIELVKAV
jgi:hypothetical protein